MFEISKADEKIVRVEQKLKELDVILLREGRGEKERKEIQEAFSVLSEDKEWHPARTTTATAIQLSAIYFDLPEEAQRITAELFEESDCLAMKQVLHADKKALEIKNFFDEWDRFDKLNPEEKEKIIAVEKAASLLREAVTAFSRKLTPEILQKLQGVEVEIRTGDGKEIVTAKIEPPPENEKIKEIKEG